MIYITNIIHLEWYRIFLHTAKLGNLTKAGRALHITQPSVSYAIKQLEETLETKLFHRLSKGVTLTPEGAALLDYVERSFSLLELGEKKLVSLKNLHSGELRIGASGPIIKHMLLSPLDGLRAQYPDIGIRLSQGKTPDILTQLMNGQIDLGFVHLPVTEHELKVEQLATIQDCFVVGPVYRQLAEQPLPTSEIIKLPLLLLTEGSRTRQFIEHWFANQGFTIDVAIELNSTEMLIELAQRGYGAAFVTRSFVQEELQSGQLIELQTIEPIPSRAIGAASRLNSSLPLIAKMFIQQIFSLSSEFSDPSVK